MIHLSRYLIGIRHSRAFRMRDFSGQIIDDIVKKYPKEFTRVGESRDEVAVTNDDESLIAKINRDDIIIDAKKIFDLEKKSYAEVDKGKAISMAEELVTIVAHRFSLDKDFTRIGVIFEFRIPEFEGISNGNFSNFIYEKFVNFETQGEKSEANIRLVYKIPLPEARVTKGLKDYRNVIITSNQSKGIGEDGKLKNCLFISVDIQRIFDPEVKTVNIGEHCDFSQQHLKEIVLPELKKKGININYE